MWPTLETRLTSNWRLAKSFRHMFDAWEAANRFVDAYPIGYTVSADWEPRIGGYVVEVFGERPGPRRWLKERT